VRSSGRGLARQQPVVTCRPADRRPRQLDAPTPARIPLRLQATYQLIEGGVSRGARPQPGELAEAQPEPEPGGGGLGFLLIQAAQAWRNRVAARLSDTGVTPAQFFVLVTLLRHGRRTVAPLSQRQVADRTRMDVNTTSQVVRALAARGLLSRAPHPRDSRAVALTLTADGAALAQACAIRVREVNAAFFAGVDPGPLRAALRSLLQEAESR
jgi:DNA-binding MarR family transcriptional regulator